MFKLTTKSKEILEGGSLNKRQLAHIKRQKVYKYIIEHPDVGTNAELATAAGYNMGVIGSSEYQSGSSFISKMIRDGYIQKETVHGITCFYISNKEPIESDLVKPPKHIENLDDYNKVRFAEERLQEEIEEYEEEMGPEGQPKADRYSESNITEIITEHPIWYNGEITLKTGKGNAIVITFADKSKEDIVNMINKINLEVL